MKPRPDTIGKRIELLGLYSSVSPEELEAARVQALRRLESAGEVVFEEAGDAAPRRSKPRWIAVAGIAAAIALAVVLPTRIVRSAPAVLEDANGTRQVQYDEVVRPAGRTSAMLHMADGARIEVRSESEVSLERVEDGGTRIHLTRGGMVVNAAGQPDGKLFVMTKDMLAAVDGAVSFANAEEGGSRIAAIGGEVRLQQGLTVKRLRPGEQFFSNAQMERVSLERELTWSRQAVTHVAALQEGVTGIISQGPNEERLEFEVASIRPAAPVSTPSGPQARGGGGPSRGRAPCASEAIQLDPRRLTIRTASLNELIAMAYGRCSDLAGAGFSAGTRFPRLSGGPEWARSEFWDVEALIPAGAADPLPTGFLGPAGEFLEGRSPKVQQMLRLLLEERFKTAVRRELAQMPVYMLTVAPGGTKFQGNALPNIPAGAVFGFIGAGGVLTSPADGAESTRINLAARCNGESSGRGCSKVAFWNQYMASAASVLSGFAGRPVLDRTSIQEKVSFSVEWARDPVPGNQIPPPPTFQTLSRALEAVGLELKEEQNGLVERFVIEHAERPPAN